jgi:hypothetical protein
MVGLRLVRGRVKCLLPHEREEARRLFGFIKVTPGQVNFVEALGPDDVVPGGKPSGELGGFLLTLLEVLLPLLVGIGELFVLAVLVR